MDDLLKKYATLLTIPTLNAGLFLVSVLGAYYLANLTWILFSPNPVVNVKPIQIASDKVSTTSRVTDSAFLVFGQYTQIEQATSEQVIDVPVTNLKLTLQGVFASNNPEEGSAIIGNASGKSDFVSVGGDVFEQALLAKVYEDRIILDRKGIFETLFFEIPDPATQSNNVTTAPPSNTGRQVDSRAISAQSSSAADVIAEMRELAYSNPQSLIDRMGLEAGVDGYQVTRRARQLLFLGLRPGDRIVSVNDNSVGNVNQDVALLDQVLSSGEVKIEIQRGNRRFSIYQTLPQ